MLIQFIVKNLYSFDEATEFNLFTNNSQQLLHHKKCHKDVEYLRLSAMYGANASGKSNFVKAIKLMQNIVEEGKVPSYTKDYKFSLNSENLNEPISLGIEFLSNNKMYYYTLTFDDKSVLNEELLETHKDKEDKVIFQRSLVSDKQVIPFIREKPQDEKEKVFLEVLAKLIAKDELLLTFLVKKIHGYDDVDNAFLWFTDTLTVLKTDFTIRGIAHKFDEDKKTISFANSFISTLSAGIEGITVEKKEVVLDNTSDNKEISNLIKTIKKSPLSFFSTKDPQTGEEATFVIEDSDKVFVKRLFTEHLGKDGTKIHFPYGWESDGTKRLLEYVPLINAILNEEVVFIVDEIERSIHPMLIKEIIKKISADKGAKGQLIFTTHESCLLDQEILRPDEIWFAEKDTEGASHLYSLSDFNIHEQANIEDGYLNGRYGGIPFLSNLEDLNWHNNE